VFSEKGMCEDPEILVVGPEREASTVLIWWWRHRHSGEARRRQQRLARPAIGAGDDQEGGVEGEAVCEEEGKKGRKEEGEVEMAGGRTSGRREAGGGDQNTGWLLLTIGRPEADSQSRRQQIDCWLPSGQHRPPTFALPEAPLDPPVHSTVNSRIESPSFPIRHARQKSP
jgi:hypothetical protein